MGDSCSHCTVHKCINVVLLSQIGMRVVVEHFKVQTIDVIKPLTLLRSQLFKVLGRSGVVMRPRVALVNLFLVLEQHVGQVLMVKHVSDVIVKGLHVTNEVKVDVTKSASVNETSPMQVDKARLIRTGTLVKLVDDVVDKGVKFGAQLLGQLGKVLVLVVPDLVFKSRDESGDREKKGSS